MPDKNFNYYVFGNRISLKISILSKINGSKAVRCGEFDGRTDVTVRCLIPVNFYKTRQW